MSQSEWKSRSSKNYETDLISSELGWGNQIAIVDYNCLFHTCTDYIYYTLLLVYPIYSKINPWMFFLAYLASIYSRFRRHKSSVTASIFTSAKLSGRSKKPKVNTCYCTWEKQVTEFKDNDVLFFKGWGIGLKLYEKKLARSV